MVAFVVNTNWFYDLFADSAAWMLIFCGWMAIVWLVYEGSRKGGFLRSIREEWEMDEVSKVLRVIIILGIGLGVLIVAVGIITIVGDIPPSFKYRDNIGDHVDYLTSISLLVLGLIMFIKPQVDIPWATIIGIAAGAIATILVAVFMPSAIIQDYDIKWWLVGIFLIVSAIVGLTVKFWLGAIEFLSKLFSWPPIALLLGIYCFVQGILLLVWGRTLILF
jgi:hypothetical protein